MPSFDIVSQIDKHELANALDQANREVSTRFDFKDTNAKFELQENTITLTSPSDFQIRQMQEILNNKLSKRNIDTRCLQYGTIQKSLHEAKLNVDFQEGIEREFAKKITKLIKDANLKVQTSIEGDKVRVTGKKKDDLQAAIAILREAKLEQALQFINFRD